LFYVPHLIYIYIYIYIYIECFILISLSKYFKNYTR